MLHSDLHRRLEKNGKSLKTYGFPDCPDVTNELAEQRALHKAAANQTLLEHLNTTHPNNVEQQQHFDYVMRRIDEHVAAEAVPGTDIISAYTTSHACRPVPVRTCLAAPPE
jgi:hypothetical protein